MLKPCKIKDLHTPTLNTPSMFLLQEPQQHLLKRNQLSTTPLPPYTPYYSHFQQPFRLHIPIHLHSFHTSLHPHFRQPFLPPHNSLPTPYLLSPHSLSSPSTTPPTSTTSPYYSHFHFHIFHLTPPFPPQLPPHTVNKHIIYW